MINAIIEQEDMGKKTPSGSIKEVQKRSQEK